MRNETFFIFFSFYLAFLDGNMSLERIRRAATVNREAECKVWLFLAGNCSLFTVRSKSACVECGGVLCVQDLAQYVNEVKRDIETLRDIDQYQKSIENLVSKITRFGLNHRMPF